MSEWEITPTEQPGDTSIPASAWGFGGGETNDDSSQGGGGQGVEDDYGVSGTNDSSGWGTGTGEQSQGGGNNDGWGTGTGGDNYGQEESDNSYGGNGYEGGRGEGGYRGRGRGGGSFGGRGRGDRGDGGWPGAREYDNPPHGGGDRYGNGNGNGNDYSGGYGGGGRGEFDGGYSSRGGMGGDFGSRGGFGGGRGSFGGGNSGGFPPRRERSNFDMGVTPPDWSKLSLPDFDRDFYKEHSKVAERTQEEVEEWRTKHSVTVDSGDAPKPVLTWGETKLPKYVLEEYVIEKGYKAPTTIQCQSIPMALSGRDLIAISETGSGKTLAYAAPAMVHIAAQPPTAPHEGPIALILAPTRELATQILRECQALGKGGNVRSACAYGGVPRSEQLMEIRKGVDILIATPGRIIDYLSAGDVTLERVTFFVLDEADRMISLGFEKEVKQICSMIRPDRQTLMFSATFPPEVRSIAREFYRDAITVHLGLDVLTACSNIDQRVEIHRNFGQKIKRLHQVLVDEVAPVEGKALIFVNKKVTATEVTDYLRQNAIEAISLHGDKRQEERDFALSEFRAGTIPVLVASAVAERGLDIPDVTIVINFDCPQDASSYVHRIGRTGRAGKKGKALTFFGMRDNEGASQIIQVLGSNEVEVPEDLQELAQGYGSSSLPYSSAPEFGEDQVVDNSSFEPIVDTWGSSGDATTTEGPTGDRTPDGWEVPTSSSAESTEEVEKGVAGLSVEGWNVPTQQQEGGGNEGEGHEGEEGNDDSRTVIDSASTSFEKGENAAGGGGEKLVNLY
ncbi:uncharacterized protein JCM6883_000371 [Sporobolomyces salmoneus]|uniref:uncharacterized protein n=1 Tax=Sporobolomyces salmoneus TaxID=183962 RepID=UPI003179AA18